MKRLLAILSAALLCTVSFADGRYFSFSGKVLDQDNGKPVEFATVILPRTEQWAIADAEGRFLIRNVPEGKNTVSISCLGYVTDDREIVISRDISNYKISLRPDNLTLESVVITAKENENSATTSRSIDKKALDHIQMVNVADISSLLPGGSTTNPELTSEQRFNIRAGSGSERGNSSFGTAVEIDGVRLSNNASFGGGSGGLKGVTTNNIASSNVESVEIITGVPSVEYGDMTSGIVKVNTKKGKTPVIISLSTNPKTKQVAVSKGFGLGCSKRNASNGVINASAEYTRSIGNRMSPYTSYDRKQISLTYSNLFNKGRLTETPLRFSASVSGNIGGVDNKADPDLQTDTYYKKRDNSVRGNIEFNWLLSRKWITNVELKASAVYGDRREKERSSYTNAFSTTSIHGKEEGYFVSADFQDGQDQPAVLIPSGNRYNNMYTDDKPFNYRVSLKGNWARTFGIVNNKIKLGADWTGDVNFGIGQYTDDLSTAPSFREWRYCDIPFMNNIAVYLEENITIPIGKTRLNVIAGLRNDNTLIRNSLYGKTSSLSPRFNLKYTIFSPKDRLRKTVKELSIRASWGMAVKQPSFSTLYPRPSYEDIEAFIPTSGSDASAYYGYYIRPKTIGYNPSLRWQKNKMAEAGIEIDIDGYRLSLAGYCTRTLDSYMTGMEYDEFSFSYTDPEILEAGTGIPADDRRFEVDQRTGTVTVHDKTGRLPSQTLVPKLKERFSTSSFASNSHSPVTRYGLEWVIDFKKIRPINTTIRLDGSFYGYRSVDTDLIAYSPYTSKMVNGNYYRYVGYFTGGNALSNGSESQSVNTNLTITTHIPKVRMIVSVKLEAHLHNYSRFLSQNKDGERSHVISDKSDVLSFKEGASIYDGDCYAVTFPEYYRIYGDPTPRDYLKDLEWAAANDREMYNDLSRLAQTSNYKFHYNKDYLSPYFSANVSVTKEIGDLASISFYANNFFNHQGQVWSTKMRKYQSITSYIPNFFYGLSVRFKF